MVTLKVVAIDPLRLRLEGSPPLFPDMVLVLPQPLWLINEANGTATIPMLICLPDAVNNWRHIFLPRKGSTWETDAETDFLQLLPPWRLVHRFG